MKLPTNQACRKNLLRNTRMVVLLAVLTLTACATQRRISPTPPPLQGSAVNVQIADVDVLAVTPAMNRFLQRYVLPYANPETRLNLLTMAVVENGLLGFSYDDLRTSTAAETFERRSGNCLSHANMLVALARQAGLEASYQEVVIEPEWTSRENTLLLRKHINVVLTSPQSSQNVDVSGTHASQAMRRQILSDRQSKAMYYNNLGADALIENDLPTAYAYMVKAIDTEPAMADPWVNLGVVFNRNGQTADAEKSYKIALQINPVEYSAMNNLYAVYRSQNRMDAAEKLQRRVENYRRNNPYYLLILSREALEQSRFEESIGLLNRAIKIKEEDHRLHFELARALYLSGDIVAAEKSLLRARRLARQDGLVEYNRPLNELIGIQ